MGRMEEEEEDPSSSTINIVHRHRPSSSSIVVRLRIHDRYQNCSSGNAASVRNTPKRGPRHTPYSPSETIDPVARATRRRFEGRARQAHRYPTPNHHAQVSKRSLVLQAKLHQTTTAITTITITTTIITNY